MPTHRHHLVWVVVNVDVKTQLQPGVYDRILEEAAKESKKRKGNVAVET